MTKPVQKPKKKNTDKGSTRVEIAERVSKVIVENATPNHAFLDEVDFVEVSTPDYKELVRLKTLSTAFTGDALEVVEDPKLGLGQRYVSLESLFGKIYAQVLMTDEIQKDALIDVESEVIRIAKEDFLNMLVRELLFGDNTRANGAQRLRGMLNHRIERPHGFAEALKDDSERNPDYYQVIKTGSNGSFGDSNDAIRSYFSRLKKSLPSKYKRNAKWFMNADVFEALEQIVDTTGQPLLITWGRSAYGSEESFLMLGHPIVIIDQMENQGIEATPVMFGDLRSAFKVLDLDGESAYLTVDSVSIKGAHIVYFDSRYGEIMQANDALRIALQAV